MSRSTYSKDPVEDGELIVVAGNHAQYERYLYDNKLSSKDVRYISHVDQVYGLRGSKLITVGTWGTDPDKVKIVEYLKAVL